MCVHAKSHIWIFIAAFIHNCPNLGATIRTGKSNHFWEDLPNPGIEPRSPAWWADSLPAEPQEKPKNTGVGSLSSADFSSRSSRPRNWIGVFCIAGRFFTNWAIREQPRCSFSKWMNKQTDTSRQQMYIWERSFLKQLKIIAWEIPWTEKPGELQSMALQRVRRDRAANQWTRTTMKTAGLILK